MEDNKYWLVLVTRHSYGKLNGKISLTAKCASPTREPCEARLKQLTDRAKQCSQDPAEYHVVDRAGLDKLRAMVTKASEKRVAEGKKRAAKTRERNKARGMEPKSPVRVMCPICKASSKKLYTEFGGLQTRKCKSGHEFEYDKWIADRPLLLLNALISGTPISRSTKK